MQQTDRARLSANYTRRVGRIVSALAKHGFKAGDRLAILLPNEPDYIQLVYACAWLGVTAVPLNTRLSVKEIDGILGDANPRGLIRHSSLPVPTVQVSWQLVLDQEPLEVRSDSVPDPIYDPDAILALIYTSGTTGQPKGVEMRHSNILENVYHTNFWFPLEEGAVHLHAAPIFILDGPFLSVVFGVTQAVIGAADVRVSRGIEGEIDVIDAARGDRGCVPTIGAGLAEGIFPFGSVRAVTEMDVAVGVEGNRSRVAGFIHIFALPIPHLSADSGRKQKQNRERQQNERRKLPV